MSEQRPWDGYGEYLGLPQLLKCQRPASAAAGAPVHDEMLFIQFHQIYELWFSQILYELDDIQQRFSHEVVDDQDMQPILAYLNRIVEIFKQLESMIDVLETMPAQSFIDFREYLGTSSGFQSLQFRLIETRLGLRRKDRLSVLHGQFDDNLRSESKTALQKAEGSPSLYDQLEQWLARTPFVQSGSYQFWEEYRAAVYAMFDEKAAHATANLDGESQAKELQAIERGREKFDGIFDAAKHEKAREQGQWRMELKALQAALFINIYREEPVLQAPYRLLTHMMDVDELLTRWRYRHALMVQRMMGVSVGTGGSSGYEYLMKTVAQHRIFSDLFGLSTYLIPSSGRPALPGAIRDGMRYRYSAECA